MKEILTITQAKEPLPLIFDSPHSGAHYPQDFDFACDEAALRTSEDKWVDDLFARVPAHGGALLCALFPRCYMDVNRAPDDIDPQLLADDVQHDFNPTARSDAGIGLIWRLAKPGVPIYQRHLTLAEIENRIEKFYKSYHAALEKLINAAHYDFGQVWHINCHSMPSATAYPKRPIGLVGQQTKPVDFVLGNRDGTTCSHDFTNEIRVFLQELGYSVTLNDPFRGVELVRRHSDPSRGRHSLQIEINRALYMDEETGKKSSDYKAIQGDIDKLIQFTSSYVEKNLVPKAAD